MLKEVSTSHSGSEEPWTGGREKLYRGFLLDPVIWSPRYLTTVDNRVVRFVENKVKNSYKILNFHIIVVLLNITSPKFYENDEKIEIPCPVLICDSSGLRKNYGIRKLSPVFKYFNSCLGENSESC